MIALRRIKCVMLALPLAIPTACTLPPVPKPHPSATGILSSTTDVGSITRVAQVAVSGDGAVLVFCGSAGGDSREQPDVASQLYLLHASTSIVTHLTRNVSGQAANGNCFNAALSHDGQKIAFLSEATNLCDDHASTGAQVFVYDAATSSFSCLSLTVDGAGANGACTDIALSADGTTVAFSSRSNLLGLDENGIAFDLNGRSDVFIRDLHTKQLERVSVTAEGFQATGGDSFGVSLSGDGQLVAFLSEATNLALFDENNAADIFLYDRRSRQVTRVVSVRGVEANGASSAAVLSQDGEWIAFQSDADNMPRADLNSAPDILLYEVATRDVRLCSVDHAGAQLAEGGMRPSISADGRYVAFEVLRTRRLPDGRAYVDPDVLIYDRAKNATRGIDPDSAAPLLRPCATLLCPLPFKSYAPRLNATGDLLAYLAGYEGEPSAYWLRLVQE